MRLASATLPKLAPTAPSNDDVEMIAVDSAASAYWSRWRGPSGQGIVDGSGYADSWSKTENVRWRTL